MSFSFWEALPRAELLSLSVTFITAASYSEGFQCSCLSLLEFKGLCETSWREEKEDDSEVKIAVRIHRQLRCKNRAKLTLYLMEM